MSQPPIAFCPAPAAAPPAVDRPRSRVIEAPARSAVLWVVALCSACATTPPGTPDANVEEDYRRREAANAALQARQDEFQRVLLALDKALDKFVQNIVEMGLQRADRAAQGLEDYLRKTVSKHFDELVRTADDPSNARNQAIAVGALGLSGRKEALDPLLNAIRSPDPVVAANAVFALGMLKDENTPPQPIADAIENPELSLDARRGAAWSLVEIQSAIHEPQRVAPVWLRLIQAPEGAVDALVLMQALRGLGHLRDAALAEYVEPFLGHPTPAVRLAAATSLGLIRNRDSWEALVTALDPSETNPNVRLAVRKALSALAGGIDRGYDVRQWRRVFETGS